MYVISKFKNNKHWAETYPVELVNYMSGSVFKTVWEKHWSHGLDTLTSSVPSSLLLSLGSEVH